MPQQRHSGHLNPNESLTETLNPSDSRRVSSVCCYSFLSASLVLGTPPPPIRPVREITDEAIPSKVVGRLGGGANQSVMNRWGSVQYDETKLVSVVWDCVVDKKPG